MRVNIYKLRRGAKDWVIDEKHPIAVVTVKDGQAVFISTIRVGRDIYVNYSLNLPALSGAAG